MTDVQIRGYVSRNLSTKDLKREKEEAEDDLLTDELMEMKNTIVNLKMVFQKKYRDLYNKRYYWEVTSHVKRLDNQNNYYRKHREEILQKAKDKYRERKSEIDLNKIETKKKKKKEKENTTESE